MCYGCGTLGIDCIVFDDLGQYCSLDCQALRAKRGGTNVPKTLVCPVCSTKFLTRKWRSVKYCSTECKVNGNRVAARERHQRLMAERGPVKIWSCGFCAGDIELPVSYTGAGKYHDDCKVKARRARNRIKTVRRQGAKSVERITHEEVAERDGFVCHICKQLVDMSLPRTSKLGATLDHVIPISKGGVDSLENLKLAHWVCNVRKSDKLEDAGA
jgi:Restriction endonuclease